MALSSSEGVTFTLAHIPISQVTQTAHPNSSNLPTPTLRRVSNTAPHMQQTMPKTANS